MPMTNSVVVDQVAALDLVDQLRVAVPEEVRQAKRINEETTRLVERAQEEAERILARAQEQAAFLIEERELTRAAEIRSQQIVAQGHADADEIRRGADQYAATVLIRTMGGSSGPLLGTFFLRAGATCAGKSELAPADVVALFQAGVEGLQQRGKAVLGDKTMLDALIPAVDAMRSALEAGSDQTEILERGAAAAEAGVRATITMQARKGRGSYLGERSVGHQDPGATGSYLLIKAAADTWRS